MNTLTPAQLDKQSPVKIDRYIDVNSAESKLLDEYRTYTGDGCDLLNVKKLLLWALDSGMLFLDSSGRIWGNKQNSDEKYPLHFESGDKLIGYRVSKKATN